MRKRSPGWRVNRSVGFVHCYALLFFSQFSKYNLMKHFTEFKNPAFFFSIGYLQFQTVDLRRSKSKMEAAETLYLELVNVHLLFQFLHYQNFIIFILTYSSIQNWKKTWSKKTKIYRQKKVKFASLESKEDFERQKWKKKKKSFYRNCTKRPGVLFNIIQGNPSKLRYVVLISSVARYSRIWDGHIFSPQKSFQILSSHYFGHCTTLFDGAKNCLPPFATCDRSGQLTISSFACQVRRSQNEHNFSLVVSAAMVALVRDHFSLSTSRENPNLKKNARSVLLTFSFGGALMENVIATCTMRHQMSPCDARRRDTPGHVTHGEPRALSNVLFVCASYPFFSKIFSQFSNAFFTKHPLKLKCSRTWIVQKKFFFLIIIDLDC